MGVLVAEQEPPVLYATKYVVFVVSVLGVVYDGPHANWLPPVSALDHETPSPAIGAAIDSVVGVPQTTLKLVVVGVRAGSGLTVTTTGSLALAQ